MFAPKAPLLIRFQAAAVIVIVGLAMALAPMPLAAQSGQAQPQKPAEQAPAEAGGPQGDIGPMAIPKKKEEPPPAPKPKLKNPEGMPDFSLRVDVPLVNVDVSVLTKDGQFIDNLKAENFRVLEDGIPQKVTAFGKSEAPITAVLLVEFANTYYRFMYDALNASYAFANSLKKDDWVAVVAYDMKTHILADFTQDKREIYSAIDTLRVPGFSEMNVFDALYDTVDRLEGIEGRKYIILVGTGVDTFSRLRYDDILKKLKTTENIQIYTISTGRALREWVQDRAGRNWGRTLQNLEFLQAENQMRTFAKLTGGQAYYPRFQAEFREIFARVGNNIRNQYTLAYHPTNAKQDGSYRKLKIEMTDGAGGPMTVRDEKGKDVKYMVLAREGYNAKHEVE